MLTYGKAKELKDAGFPQKYINIYDQTCSDPKHGTLAHMGVCCGLYEPTLSELIEACGDAFLQLYRVCDGVWGASAGGLDGPEKGNTSKEAVANLWLALNKK